ncbi:NADH-quinone oxidoreductase subunit C [Melghirimyces profundicolus]|uniref:NADH-quinone oxidoreductase subunit C n=1 Tax=Melghirimyces profundicolus TaxID=1242148 RepID=A0A2T6C2H3_9BACL|nr:NADH-quinone oxidoreductase subunit C [Melghirimyces profundicolus]PTX62521.1 NADH-quinone oxidoreductase subunit C [Melghirimyces profundicolus]
MSGCDGEKKETPEPVETKKEQREGGRNGTEADPEPKAGKPEADSVDHSGRKKEEPPEKTEGAARAAKAAAAAKPRAAAAKKRPAAKKKPEKPPEPSPKQPLLDSFVTRLKEKVGDKAVKDSFINRPDGHRPVIVALPDAWPESARLLRHEEDLQFDYLQNLSGVDDEDHMEVVYHLVSLKHGHSLCVKVKTEREDPQVPSVTGVWAAADWHEREVYDLLGIRFPGHPNLKRILMPDDWVGHPLRKDYEPYDREI